MKPLVKKSLLSVAAMAVIAGLGATAYLWTPGGQTFDAEEAQMVAAKYDVRIIRDTYGVPHIFGETDADAHF
ncbi:MAG: hypothetical protein AAF926_08265, partial [Pseudomonadota bacterium]